MGKRKYNYRLVKIHRNYTVGDVAELCGIHKNTVRRWINNEGLGTIDNKRPALIHGLVLREFIKHHRVKNKHPCKQGEMYCVRCHTPKIPAENMVECISITEKLGNLIAMCPDCGSIINRRINMAKIREVCGKMDVTFLKGE